MHNKRTNMIYFFVVMNFLEENVKNYKEDLEDEEKKKCSPPKRL